MSVQRTAWETLRIPAGQAEHHTLAGPEVRRRILVWPAADDGPVDGREERPRIPAWPPAAACVGHHSFLVSVAGGDGLPTGDTRLVDDLVPTDGILSDLAAAAVDYKLLDPVAADGCILLDHADVVAVAYYTLGPAAVAVVASVCYCASDPVKARWAVPACHSSCHPQAWNLPVALPTCPCASF